MSCPIVGSGKIGQDLAHAFARKDLHMTVASRWSPKELAPQAPGDWAHCSRQAAAVPREFQRNLQRGASRPPCRG